MILIPAIDIKGGKVVRLFQGRFSDVTQYADDPVAMARKWEGMGAQWLHLVDLDGAKDGVMANKDAITRIAQEVSIPVEVGGGIRNAQTVGDLISAGVARVILGTTAIENRRFLNDMISHYGEKICVSVDCDGGRVAGRGWVAPTTILGIDLARELQAEGLRWMVYTDINRDGTLAGPNFDQLEQIISAVPNINVIASGGIATLADVERLAGTQGVAAAITGKAIYEDKLNFKEAIERIKVIKKHAK